MSGKLSQHLQTTAASAATSADPFVRFRHQLNMVRKDVAAMIGEDKVERFIRVCLNAVQYNRDTLNADRRSLLLACMEAAQDGLLPDGEHAVFNVYRTKDVEKSKAAGSDVYVSVVQYLPMAYGLVQLIWKSGATRVDAVAVYEKDDFKYTRGDAAGIFHEPYDGDEEPGKVKAAYIIVEYPGLAPKREVMFRRDIEKVRSKSKAKEGLMWKDFYDQAAIKSVIHRVWKQLPSSEALGRALRHDNKSQGLEGVSDLPVEETGTNLSALADGVVGQETMPEAKVPSGKVHEGKVESKTEERVGERAAEPGGDKGSTKEDPPLPKEGDPGTPEMKATFIKKMDASKDLDVLGIAYDDVRFFKWSPEDAAELKAKYEERKAAISGG